ETHGQDGPQHIIPDELLKKADYVMIASDIHIDSDRFFGKRLYRCDTNEVINTPSVAFKNMEQKAFLVSAGSGYVNPQAMKKQKNGFMKHFLSGVSHMIPVLVFSGIICSIITAIVNGVVGHAPTEWTGSYVDWLLSQDSTKWAGVLMTIANVGFTLFTAVMGGYIAESIAGRAAFAPGLIASFVMGNTGNGWVWWWPGIPQSAHVQVSGQWVDIQGISIGVVAAIIMGFAAGYLVKLVLAKIKVKDTYKPLLSILFIPVVCTSALVFPYVFLLSAVFCCAMNYIGAGIAIAGGVPGVNFLIGFLLGLMVGVDMGGPINKIAVSTATGLIQVDPRFMGACAAAIPIAPLATGLCCVMFRKLFDEEDFKNGVAAIGLGCMGISEGAIPMFTKYPKQTFVANIIGGAVAGGLAFTFFVG
ncbi:MAG: PTS transporter subunit EIIC, partial [Malacoplasma sp.]|nr:PTS transporter subunit EIIC [Malacoplasma sp.]